MYANTKQARGKNKRVRFKGLDNIDIEEEEKKLREKPKLAKDAPMGAEFENKWKLDDGEDSDEEGSVKEIAVTV